MASEEVAAGEGAFRTLVIPSLWLIRKSSTREPSRSTAWARRPERAADDVAGTDLGHVAGRRPHVLPDRERAGHLLHARTPVRLAIRQKPGQLTRLPMSRGLAAVRR